jgi:hypothetical protein
MNNTYLIRAAFELQRLEDSKSDHFAEIVLKFEVEKCHVRLDDHWPIENHDLDD